MGDGSIVGLEMEKTHMQVFGNPESCCRPIAQFSATPIDGNSTARFYNLLAWSVQGPGKAVLFYPNTV